MGSWSEFILSTDLNGLNLVMSPQWLAEQIKIVFGGTLFQVRLKELIQVRLKGKWIAHQKSQTLQWDAMREPAMRQQAVKVHLNDKI